MSDASRGYLGVAIAATQIFEALHATGCAGLEVSVRETGRGKPFVTDGGNVILDARAERIPNPKDLADALKRITGVVDHGLFIGLAKTIILGKAKGVEVRAL